MPQYRMESVLRKKIAALAQVDARYGWSATAIAQDDRAVRVSIAQEGGAGTDVLEAEYVVGCDGARSVVRDQVGIERGGTNFEQLMVLAVFRSRALHERLKRFPAFLWRRAASDFQADRVDLVPAQVSARNPCRKATRITVASR
jgi:2-polyprenyl-6-methoxyphenol hydroxylase-like FAD-dependent oxidoreductase